MATGSERVFDPLVRIGHWAGALAFLVAFVTAGRPLTLHTRVGYALAAYAVWRLVWGLVGPSRARFSDLVSSPRAYLADLWGLATARPIPYRGLGPVGSLLAVAMLVAVVAASLAGTVTLAARHGEGPLAAVLGTVPEPLPQAVVEYGADGGMTTIPRTDRASVDAGSDHPDVRPGRAEKNLHGTLALVALWLVIAHVAHVLYISVLRGENLMFDMVSGRRAGPQAPEETTARLRQPLADPAATDPEAADPATADTPTVDPAAADAAAAARPSAADEPQSPAEPEAGAATDEDEERAQRKLQRKAARRQARRAGG